MSHFNYKQIAFLKSAAKLSQLPPDTGAEIAFIGISNVGKSSVLNRLTGQKIAKTSKTPGRTQLINFFVLDDEHRLVDLPGFGYAKVPLKVRQKWQTLIDDYLRTRKSLKGFLLVMDIRHPFRDFESDMLKWAHTAKLPIHILLTKADKLRYGARLNAFHAAREKLKQFQLEPSENNYFTISLFSSKTDIGKKELIEKLDDWLL